MPYLSTELACPTGNNPGHPPSPVPNLFFGLSFDPVSFTSFTILPFHLSQSVLHLSLKKALAAKLNKLSSIPETHKVKGEN